MQWSLFLRGTIQLFGTQEMMQGEIESLLINFSW